MQCREKDVLCALKKKTHGGDRDWLEIGTGEGNSRSQLFADRLLYFFALIRCGGAEANRENMSCVNVQLHVIQFHANFIHYASMRNLH